MTIFRISAWQQTALLDPKGKQFFGFPALMPESRTELLPGVARLLDDFDIIYFVPHGLGPRVVQCTILFMILHTVHGRHALGS